MSTKIAVVIALVIAGAVFGFFKANETPPLLYFDNETDGAVEVEVLIHEYYPPYDIVLDSAFTVAGGAPDVEVPVRGLHNVTVSYGNYTDSRVMEFWYGGWLGGQMYVGIRIEDAGIQLFEMHAD